MWPWTLQVEARPHPGGDGREPFHLPGLASCPLALCGGGRWQGGNERGLFGQPDPATATGVTGCLCGSISSPINMRIVMTPSAMLSQGLNTGKTLACGNRSMCGSCYHRGLLAGWLPVLVCSMCSVLSQVTQWVWASTVGPPSPWLPGSLPPGLTGVDSPEDEACLGTSRCAWPALAGHATCPDGWERLSSALNYPEMGLLIFPSDEE